MCSASGLHNDQTHLPLSFSFSSTAFFHQRLEIWSFIFFFFNSSLSVHTASSCRDIAQVSVFREIASEHPPSARIQCYCLVDSNPARLLFLVSHVVNVIAQWPQHYDYQPKVDSNTTKPCYHARMAGVFTLFNLQRSRTRVNTCQTSVLTRYSQLNFWLKFRKPLKVWTLGRATNDPEVR